MEFYSFQKTLTRIIVSCSITSAGGTDEFSIVRDDCDLGALVAVHKVAIL